MILRANNNSVRTKLGYLANKNKVWRVTKGLYQSTSGIIKEEFDPDIRFHGIDFSYKCIKRSPWGYPHLKKVVTVDLKTPWLRKHPNNHSWLNSIEWEGRLINIALHPGIDTDPRIDISNRSSLLPLHPIEFGAYCGFLYGIFKIPYDFWELIQIGINIDKRNTQLDGWKNISMKVAQGRILRMYQKAKDLRLETHTSPNMNAREAMNYLEKVLVIAEEISGEN